MRTNKCSICNTQSSKTKICPSCGNEVCKEHCDTEHFCCEECVGEVADREILNDIEEW